jgi:OOP family OmpA-OmpF porin
MFNKNIIVATLGMAVLMTGANAAAAAYAGAAVGRSDGETIYKVMGGYELNQSWAVEASYIDLGKKTASYSIGYATANAEASAYGVDVAGVFRLPIANDWNLLAKLGVAYIKADATASMSGYSTSASTNSTGLLAGVGATYKLSERVLARAEVESRSVSGSSNTSVSIGIQVGF